MRDGALGLPVPDTDNPDAEYRGALSTLIALSERPARGVTRAHKVERMRRLLALWGGPVGAFPMVLVAGTKGKGSTTAMLAAILRADGRRVGRFTSPHLVSFRERIWTDGAYIGARELASLTSELLPAIAAAEQRWPDLGHFTTFEAAVALAHAHFARARVDIAVFEVGVGGRDDATNALEP